MFSMLNPNQKLNQRFFSPDVEQVPIRNGFGEGLVLAADNDKNVVALCADLDESTKMDLFKKKYPDRFIEVGVAEQNLATVASGMAHMGKIPFIGSFAIFSPGRNWEQIRTTIAYNNVPVKIIGSHVGVSVGPDGGSHEALEDIAITRVIPRMVVISPCDVIEAKKATMAMARTKDPTYMRISRQKTPVITTTETPFEIGKAQEYFRASGKKPVVGIIATGHLLYKALLVAKKLEGEGLPSVVMNLATIKPLDEQAIIHLAHEAGAIVTVEEHQIAGGMGSAVAECLAKNFPVPIEFIGVHDKFGQSGTAEELIELYGMGEKDIYSAAKKAILRK